MAYAEDAVRARVDPGVRYVQLIAWATTATIFGAALFLAIVMPFHAGDALSSGEWSRLIALHWHLRYPDISDGTYHRPLFYVLQGWTWGVLGFSERTGRILAGMFSLLLVASLALLVARGAWGRTRAAVAALLVLAAPVFAGQIVSGLTDVPVAAMLALAGVLVWRSESPRGALFVGVASALAALTKPTAYVALVALAAAHLLGPRVELRARVLFRILPIAAGCLVGLLYDEVQARYLHEPLFRFLTAGVSGGYYAQLANAARRSAALDFSWFGYEWRIVLVFALVYGVGRIATLAHRRAVFVAAPTAALVSWLGPWIAYSEPRFRAGSLDNTRLALETAGLALVLVAAAIAPDDASPSRLELGRFLVWAVPPAGVWIAYGAYDQRLLTPAWPPLLALMAVSVAPSLAGLARLHVYAPAAAVALLVVVVSQNAENLDGLGKSGWRQLRSTPSSQWLDQDAMRRIGLPSLSRAIVLVRKTLGPHGRLISAEGAFRFYFPGRVAQTYPRSCPDLRPYRAFVLLTDEGTKQYMEQQLHVSGEPSFWAACTAPRLQQLSDGSEGYAVFRVRR